MLSGVEIAGPVVGLDGARILGPCVLGHPADGVGDAPLVLGEGVTIRAFAVLYQGASIGEGAHIGHGALVRERNHVAAGASIGSGCQLEPGNRIGQRSRIHSACFLSSSDVGDDVFVGPRVVTADDPHPPCPKYLACRGGAVIHEGASVGANVTLLPGVVLGAGCLVGAGAVVTRDVAPGDVVAGNPAVVRGRRDSLPCPPGLFARAYAWDDDRG